ncbi:class I SAM-dependent methyltransferase [Phormidesmis sp. 146-33]
MKDQDIELLEKIRQQYNNVPYPNTPLEESPKQNYQSLFFHSLVTAYYLRDQSVVDTTDKVILDAGCGSGYKSLILAEANPGAKIVGIDLSEESVDLAHKRLQFYGFDDAAFHALSIYDLPQLGLKFDYINCDEVLYLLPDMKAGLEVMRSVLKPNGMIRANLHSLIQRFGFFRAQEAFGIMGLMDGTPDDMEVEIAIETMQALKDQVNLKTMIYKPELYAQNSSEAKQRVLVNYLLLGDRGYTISDMFSAIKAADLEFINMANWQQWDILSLFQDPDKLPDFWKNKLPELSIEQRLEIIELIQPEHRLLDFLCGHINMSHPKLPLSEWTDLDWQTTTVHLHPVLKTSHIKEQLVESVSQQQPFEITRYVPKATKTRFMMDSGAIACLLPLWKKEQPFTTLVEYWLKFKPLNAAFEPVTKQEASEQVKQLLTGLEDCLFVLLARSK